MREYSRRSFLSTIALSSIVRAAVPAWLARYHLLSAADRDKVKITDIKTMILQGPRTYTLVRIDTDAGVSGFAEAYGSPGLGIREELHGVAQTFIGKDPLQIDRLYTGYRFTDGSAHAQQRAMSGIEMALWDLAGKLLNVPAHTLLGGKFRDKVRLYDHSTPRDFFDKAVLRDWAQQVKEAPSGITMHKFGPLRNRPDEDPGRDPSNRLLSTNELRRIRQGYENCREALGFDHDILIGCHWEFDLRSAIEFAEALVDVKPRFLEDPLPVAYSESWKRLANMSPVPICHRRELDAPGRGAAIYRQRRPRHHPPRPPQLGRLFGKQAHGRSRRPLFHPGGKPQHGQHRQRHGQHPLGLDHPRLLRLRNRLLRPHLDGRHHRT